MTSYHSDRLARADQNSAPAGFGHVGSDEVLAPVIAGAYARGVADTLDLFGIPGVFLDEAGDVIFASRATAPLLLGRLQLHMRHLVAEHAGDNQVLGNFIAEAVGESRDAVTVRLPGAALALRKLPRTEAATLPGQMVRAVVLIADENDPVHARLLHSLA